MYLYAQLPSCALRRWVCHPKRRERDVIGHCPARGFFPEKTSSSPATDCIKFDRRNHPFRVLSGGSLLIIGPRLVPTHLRNELVGILVRSTIAILCCIQIDSCRIAFG